MAGFERVLLYAGAPKTGTTSIQTFVWSNRIALMQQGVYVPTTGRRGAQHMEIAATLHDGKRRGNLDRHADVTDDNIAVRRRRFIRRLDLELARAPQCHTLLFMSEYLFTVTKKEATTYREFLARYAPRLESLMYLRRQDQWLASLVLQARKSGTRRELELKPGEPQRYGANIRIWETQSDACHIRRFEREFLLNGDLIEDFCSTAGADLGGLSTTEVHANPAIMQEQLDVMDVLNEKLTVMPFHRRIPYRRTFISFCADVLGGSKIEFQRDAARAVFDAYRGINGWLRHTKDPSGPPLFFNADFSDYPGVAKNDRRYSLDQLAHLRSVVAGRLRDRGLAEPPAPDAGSRDSLMDYIASAFIPLREAELRESRRALRKTRKAQRTGRRDLLRDPGFTVSDVQDLLDDDDDD